MKKLLIIASLLFVTTSQAQVDYKNAIGLRLGGANGLTFKHQMNSTTAVEGILHSYYYGRGFTITGLYEKNKSVFPQVKGFQFYYGAGAHVGMYSGGVYVTRFSNGKSYTYSSGYTNLGIDGIIGLEYKIPTIPFTASLDIKPTFEIFNPMWGFLDGGLSLRYTF